MAYRPPIGQKYAKLRAEQQAMLAAAGKALAEDMSIENQEQLAGAAAAVNAGRLNCQGLAAAGQPALAGAIEALASKSKRSPLDEKPSRSCGEDIGEWRQLERMMEQAMQLQLAQLKNLRQRSSSSEDAGPGTLLDRACPERSSVSDEEKPLQISLDNIRDTLKVARAAVASGRKALLQAVTGEVLRAMSTADVLRFRATTSLVQNATRAGTGVLLPNLDAAPADAAARGAFFAEVAFGFVRCISLPADEVLEILQLRARDLGFLADLTLPAGLGSRLAALPLPPNSPLERLSVHGGDGATGGGLDRAGVDWLKELLENLPRRLKLLELEELATELCTAVLEAALRDAPAPPERLLLRRCVLPDSAVKCVCNALPEIESSWGGWARAAIHFEDCEFSVLAENHLLQTLEECSSCAVSVDGGARCNLACDVPEWLEEARPTAAIPRRPAGCGGEESDSEQQGSQEATSSQPVPRREYDHIDQMTTSELMEVVLKRMQSDAQSSTSQAAAMANMFRAKADAAQLAEVLEPEAFGGINDPSDDEEAAALGLDLAALREDRARIERARARSDSTETSDDYDSEGYGAVTSWSPVD